MKQIISLQNPKIKLIGKLHTTKGRKEQNKFIVQGIRAIESCINAKLKFDNLFTTEEYLSESLNFVPKEKIILISKNILNKISTTKTPGGPVTVFEIPKKPNPSELGPGLVLAQISDPGNMGTLIRTAAACAVKSIVVIEGVDPWSPKVVQATAGTIGLVKIFQLNWQTLLRYKQKLQICSLVVQGGSSIREIDPSLALLVVGNEAHGLPRKWQKESDILVTLPMPGKTESLNAAIAGSIALYITFVFNN